ncbi:Tis11 [Symbiodinium pilosum]|uniref:Tis11 protein n=1 Tax=Symbiodinium pilosum TaxID=2952 RepID=A0A812SG56_SYMPI|nr:Tis11 [Symbiodinium pilosum]
MTKAEKKKAVQFTRMCRFWRTNECKMGADCTFAHTTSELRPSPKPCFEFSKTGFCPRGQACRFEHSLDSLKSGKINDFQETMLAMQQASNIQAQFNMVGTGSMTLMPPSLNAPMPGPRVSNTTSMPLQADVGSLACLRPPPGLEDMGMLTGLAPAGFRKTSLAKPKDGDSRRSSLSEVSLGLEGVSLPIPKAADLEQMWAADEATMVSKL